MDDPKRRALLQEVDPSMRQIVNALLDYVVSLIETGKNAHKDEHQYIHRRSDGNTKSIHIANEEIANISLRLHKIEDHFEEGGIVQELSVEIYALAIKLEQYIEQQRERSRHSGQEHSSDGTDTETID